MSVESAYILAADALLVVHVLFVVFLVGGLLLIYLGAWRGWSWVRNFWFRIVHLCGMGFVMLQAWAGLICPLTIWEMAFRAKAGQSTYAGSFVQHWLQTLLYYEAPFWVFGLLYTVFAAGVAASWFIVKPGPCGFLTKAQEPTEPR